MPGGVHCPECALPCHSSAHLTMHMRVHTGEKPFSCHLCEKAFAQKSKLTRHLRIHTGDKPFLCPQCGKKFIEKSDLHKHERSHLGLTQTHECHICGKLYSRNVHLMNHIRLHTGETPFSCEYCQKAFNSNIKLADHVKIHTGEELDRKTHQCEVCEKRFVRRSHLNHHYKKIHNRVPISCLATKRNTITVTESDEKAENHDLAHGEVIISGNPEKTKVENITSGKNLDDPCTETENMKNENHGEIGIDNTAVDHENVAIGEKLNHSEDNQNHSDELIFLEEQHYGREKASGKRIETDSHAVVISPYKYEPDREHHDDSFFSDLILPPLAHQGWELGSKIPQDEEDSEDSEDEEPENVVMQIVVVKEGEPFHPKVGDYIRF